MRINALLLMLLFLGGAASFIPSPLHADQDKPISFYGKQVSFLKLFGQKRWGDAAPGYVVANKVNHAAGVCVDRSSEPNHIYVADTGNNRILGFKSYDSPKADLIFGQPDEHSSAANGDCNIGFYGPTGPDQLCLTAYPWGTNVAEQWMFLHFDVDSEGNLYVPDTYNNRVLMYRAPFSEDKTGGKGDTIADVVWGQDDFRSNGINRGMGRERRDARSLFIRLGGFDHVSARGVSVDPQGNVWVADTFNYRVLRFPKGSTTADLVIGQPNFATALAERDINKAGLGRFGTPTLARINPQTGELWVIDEHPFGFKGRILIFTPPFFNGMAASRIFSIRQKLAGDFKDGYVPTHL
ncbi:MAG: hypothetical protein M3347_16450, partial [Armatimonadota bacterium]|nr:hypothetical protein [Armatimonadota bacterium]